jgi:hypothetical protein
MQELEVIRRIAIAIQEYAAVRRMVVTPMKLFELLIS